MYKQGYYCNERIYYYCCETTAMPSYLTLRLPSCLLPAAESVTNCPFKKLQACKLGMCYFYFIFLLLTQNVAVIELQVTAVLHPVFLDCAATEGGFIVQLLI